MRWIGIFSIALLLSHFAHAETAPEKRVALVVGNAAYQSVTPLRNPINDADAMAKALKSVGFDVIEVKNTSKQQLERAVGEFGRKLAHGGVGLFFYSGHGMQVNGKNYLIPVDAEIQDENAFRIETTDVDLVLEQMSIAQTRVNLVILDACRSNPFERRFRAITGGLAAVNDAPQGTLIGYSTSPGKVASDGSGVNGVYTSALLKAITTPGLAVEEVFKQVRASVTAETHNAQTPWETSSLVGSFYFSPEATSDKPSVTDPSAIELVYWQSIANSSDIQAFQSYLGRYPKGQFVDLAKLKIAAIESAAAKQFQDTAVVQPPQPKPQVQNTNNTQFMDAQSAYDRGDVSTALRLWRTLAEQGDASAQYKVGLAYVKGEGGPQDFAEGTKWFRKAAEQGYSNAQDALGIGYQSGYGVSKNIAEAVKWFRKAAAQGNPSAQNNLGLLYQSGQGIPQDFTEAINWFRKAAEQGNAAAQNNLAFMYGRGQGVTKDYAKALAWFQKSADQGFASAQLGLGYMYGNGQGVPQDFGLAYSWLSKAADQGNPEAQYLVGDMYANGHGVPQDKAQAFKWYSKAGDQGHVEAQSHLGYMFASGEGAPQDYVQAFTWYRKAAEQGDAFSQRHVGAAYAAGQGVQQNDAEALKWVRKAADQGDAPAQAFLGSAYANGQGVSQDYVEAAQWLRKAADQKDPIGEGMLGLLFSDGNGVTKNLVQAYSLVSLGIDGMEAGTDFQKTLVQERDKIAAQMTRAQLEEAEMARQHGVTVSPPPPLSPPLSSSPSVGTRQPGSAFRDSQNCPEMVVIPTGTFTMGLSQAKFA